MLLGAEVEIQWIDSEALTEETCDGVLGQLDGIIVPGGFGGRGIQGMILAAQYAREHHLPYFGICLGMQVAVIEYARHVAGIADADSGEFDEICAHKVIDFMPGQSEEIDKGGTLRLGAYPCVIQPGTTMERCYGKRKISERHRHRYEFNNDYRETAHRRGADTLRPVPGRTAGGDGGADGSPLLCGRAVPSGVQVPPQCRPPTVQRIHSGGTGALKNAKSCGMIKNHSKN